MPAITLNTPALDFELADYDGNSVRLSSFLGRNIVLIFNRGFV